MGSPERIREVAKRIAHYHSQGHQLIVVPSAMSGETNRLLGLAKQLNAEPEGRELDVIAACFIGGASAYGGVGLVSGAVIGAFIMGVMNNGMSILGIGVDYQQVIKGLVLLGAVCVDVYNQRR